MELDIISSKKCVWKIGLGCDSTVYIYYLAGAAAQTGNSNEIKQKQIKSSKYSSIDAYDIR